ncbi:MAG: helix-turn-helix transcriptional regulator [Kiloniellales bacterium]|nr:helix-turn-helix transcriptional regulator [Kiloniellales bacterium]
MTPGQSRAARSWLGWSIRKAAAEAGLSKSTVVQFEKNRPVMLETMTKLQAAFEAAGIEFSGKTAVHYRGEEA